MKVIVYLITFIFFLVFGNAAAADKNTAIQYTDISPQDAFELLQSQSDVKVLDIRTDKEYAKGHIENALHIDFYGGDFKQQLAQLDKHATFILHCHSGGRSGKSIEILQNLGFTKIKHLNKGIKGWLAEDLPTVK